MEKINTSQTRRSFLKSSLLASGGLMISFSGVAKIMSDKNINPLNPATLAEGWNELTGYIKITPDNIIKILNPNPEFGQNVMTSLPMIIAEELDVDWKKVVVEMGPHDNTKLGPQFTGGSNSVRMYWKPLREAGAAARQMLRDAAAQTWSVPVEEVTTKAGMLYHEKSGKTGTYGDFASKAAVNPIPKEVKLKEIKNFNVVGNSSKNVEGLKIVTGKPLFAMDQKYDGMLIAMIEHPTFGKKLKSFDATETLKMPGIKDVFQLKLYEDGYEQAGFDTRTFNDFLVVVGNTTWEVMNARKKLKVTWEPISETKETIAGFRGKTEVVIPAELESTSTQLAKMHEYAKKPAQQLRKDGDPETAFANAAQIIERTFTAPF
ncbi:MAG TPA: molybdopterin cofactor-binding domain-containing protein, partial [Cyclobacteriaceae bacterium]